MYKIVISELRELRDVIMNSNYSKTVKLARYHKASGFVHGFYSALVRTNGTRVITCNMIDLTYAYLTAIYKEII